MSSSSLRLANKKKPPPLQCASPRGWEEEKERALDRVKGEIEEAGRVARRRPRRHRCRPFSLGGTAFFFAIVVDVAARIVSPLANKGGRSGGVILWGCPAVRRLPPKPTTNAVAFTDDGAHEDGGGCHCAPGAAIIIIIITITPLSHSSRDGTVVLIRHITNLTTIREPPLLLLPRRPAAEAALPGTSTRPDHPSS